MLQQDAFVTDYPSTIDYYSDEWTYDWDAGVSSTSSFNPCNTPNPPWWCEEQSVPIDLGIAFALIFMCISYALLAQLVRASDS